MHSTKHTKIISKYIKYVKESPKKIQDEENKCCYPLCSRTTTKMQVADQ